MVGLIASDAGLEEPAAIAEWESNTKVTQVTVQNSSLISIFLEGGISTHCQYRRGISSSSQISSVHKVSKCHVHTL